MKTLKSSLRWLVLLTIVSVLLVLGTVQHVYAAGVVGNGTSASCTEAAFDTVLASQVETIKFNCGPAVKTITLTTTKQIVYATSINGGNKIILDAKNVRHFIYNNPKLYTLKNITLKNGKADMGGAILNYEPLTLINVKFENNNAKEVGGAIANFGALTVRKSTFTNNSAKNTGGAIYNDSGANQLGILNSTFSTLR